MRQLSQNILNTEPVYSSSVPLSSELKDVVKALLTKNCHIRPGVNAILSRPFVKAKVAAFLTSVKRNSHVTHSGREVGDESDSLSLSVYPPACLPACLSITHNYLLLQGNIVRTRMMMRIWMRVEVTHPLYYTPQQP